MLFRSQYDYPSPRSRAGPSCRPIGTAGPLPSTAPVGSLAPETTASTTPSQPSHDTGHANIVTWKKSMPETFIEIQIAGYNYRCLLDTGCDYSIIPRRLVPNATLSPAHMDIFAANGSQISILGCMTIKFHIAAMPLTANLLVSEDIHEFMLGYDWLEAQGAHWFFDCKVLLLHGKEKLLHLRLSCSYVSRVIAREHIVVSPHTAQDVPVKLVHIVPSHT